MKQRLLWGLGLFALAPFVTGCAPSKSGPSLGNLGRNFANDWTHARSFDRALVGLSRGDLRAKDLKLIEVEGRAVVERIEDGSSEARVIAEDWIGERLPEAAQSDLNAENATSYSNRDQWHTASSRSYRAALAFLPTNEKKWRAFGPQTLNALGYFLADHGQNTADFERAEKLTALSFELSPATNPTERYLRSSGPGDSHAWALFRLGKIKEALKAQAEVVASMGVNKVVNAPRLPAEIAYHWGAICRVAGHEDAARDAFKYALTQNPSPELQEILDADLSGSLV